MACETDTDKAVPLEDPANEPACQKCLAPIRLVRSIMDPAAGRTVRIFECGDCGQRTWAN